MNHSKLLLPLAGIASLIIILAGCGRKSDFAKNYLKTQEELQIRISACPDSAIYYIDQAAKDGKISEQHKDLLYSSYYSFYRREHETAIEILKGLCDQLEKKGSMDVPTDDEQMTESNYIYTDVLTSLAQEHYILCQYAHAMYYARKASKYMKQFDGDCPYMAANMDCMVGNILVRMGKVDDGYKIIDEAILFNKRSNRFHAFHSWLNCMSSKATVLYDKDSCDGVIQICDIAQRELQTIETRSNIPDFYRSGSNMEDFKDYYHGLFEAYRGTTYAKLRKLDSARVAMQRCLATDWGKSHEYTSMNLTMVYTALGMREKVDTCYNMFIATINDDTIQERMLYFLDCKADLARAQQRFDEALNYETRSKNLQKLLFNREVSEQIAHNAEMYEENRKAKEATELERFKKQVWISLIFALALIITLSIITYYHRKKNKQLKAAYKALIEKQSIINTNMKLISSVNSQTPDPSTLLFERILQVMHDSKPYLKEDFAINTLAELLNTNVNYVSRAINCGSFKTFPQWLSEYRNQIAIRALQENPNLSINELCILTGHNTRETFSRQFKMINGISFSEFKIQNKKDSNL